MCMDHANLVAVVVTYNRLENLKKTLASLLRAKDALSAIVVVDNASTDGTARWLSDQSKERLHVIHTETNLGGAGGFELGMRYAATELKAAWIVVMDDDAYPVPGSLERFVSQDRTAADAWAAAVYYPNGTICDMNRPWINPLASIKGFVRTLLKGRNGFHLSQDDYQASDHRPIDGGSFVGLFVSARAVDRIGFPDRSLFLYGDDVLYTLSLSQAGGRILFDPALVFEHDCATLNQTQNGRITPLWKVYYFHRNQTLVYARAAGPVLFWPIIALKAFTWFRRAKLYDAEDRAQYRKVLRVALRDGLTKNTNRQLQEVKALSDAPTP